MSEYNKQRIGNTSVDLTTVVAKPAVAVAGGCVRVFLLVFYHHFIHQDQDLRLSTASLSDNKTIENRY